MYLTVGADCRARHWAIAGLYPNALPLSQVSDFIKNIPLEGKIHRDDPSIMIASYPA
jgi:hypothetical protein